MTPRSPRLPLSPPSPKLSFLTRPSCFRSLSQRFKLLRDLGKGVFGWVFLVRVIDEGMPQYGSTVVLKMFHEVGTY